MLCFFGGKQKKEDTPNHFSIHKTSGFVALMVTLLFIGSIECLAVHLVVEMYSRVLAWLLTALSIYSLLFLMAHLHAVMDRRIEIKNQILSIKVGMIWNFDVERSNLLEVRKIKEINSKGTTILDTSRFLLTQPNVFIKLKEPIQIKGIYGIKKEIHAFGVYVDDVNSFIGHNSLFCQ